MTRKLYVALLPVLAVVAFAVTATAAQAAPHWYVGGKRLPFTGAKTAVTTHGELTLTDEQLLAKTKEAVVVKCTVKDAGFIFNPKSEGAGEDEITEFINEKCKATVSGKACTSATVTAEELPWKTLLTEAKAGTIRDEIKGIKVKVSLVECPEIGTASLTYSGALSPKIVNNSPTFAEFEKESGHLTSSDGTEGKVTGDDDIEGPSKAVVEAKNP